MIDDDLLMEVIKKEQENKKIDLEKKALYRMLNLMEKIAVANKLNKPYKELTEFERLLYVPKDE